MELTKFRMFSKSRIFLTTAFFAVGFFAFSSPAYGADVFYSVGQSASDLKTGTPTITISSGIATFSVAQTGNIGVGDRVTYNTNSIAYISGKTSTTVWTLITATGTTPGDVAGQTVNSITREYTSLSAAIAGASNASHLNTTDLTSGGGYTLNIPCYYDSGPDTTAVTINGYTTGTNNYIRIYTPNNTVTEANNSQRHQGKWDDGKYHLEVTGSTGVNVQDEYVKINGIQLKSTPGSNQDGIARDFGPVGVLWVSNSIIWGLPTTATYNDAICGNSMNASATIYAYNNIIYGWYFAPGATYQGGMYCNTGNCYAYNNTIYGSHSGFYDNGANFIAKNNISYNNNDNYVGTFDSPSTNNLSGPAQSDAPGSSPRNSATVSFIDATNSDFHLANSDVGARGWGANFSQDSYLPFSQDIDGEERTGNWDIGADQFMDGSINSPQAGVSANGLVGYWSFDGGNMDWSQTSAEARDVSGNNNHGDATNMTQSSVAIGKRGQALNFDGADDFINHGDVLDVGTGDFTISAWIKTTSASISAIATKSFYGSGNYRYSFFVNDTGRLNIFVVGTGGVGVDFPGNVNVADGRWHLATVVFDRDGNASIYTDGVFDASQDISQWNGLNFNSTELFRIGALGASDHVGTMYNFTGSIDEVRVHNRALSATEIADLYRSGQENINMSLAGKNTNGLIGHWTFDGQNMDWSQGSAEARDVSGNNNHGDATNATAILGKRGQALDFNGSSSSVNAGDINALDGAGALTISTWIKRDSTSHAMTPLEKGPGVNDKIGINLAGTVIYFNVSNGANTYGEISNSALGWQHFTLVFDGSQATNATRLKGYVNGAEQSLTYTGTIPATTDSNASSVLFGRSAIFSTWTDGQIDDVRVYNRALPAVEVADLYRLGQVQLKR